MSKLSDYMSISGDYSLPETMQAVTLSGAGQQNIKLSTVDVPECGDNQLLARVDAAMVCASDNKLIDQGSEHPLMYGWNVSDYPIIIGHEGSVTVVKVGKNLRGRFRPGQKFAIQPAVPTGPRSHRERYKNNAEGVNKIAIGYTLPGLFAEYVLISEEIIETGCLVSFPREDIPYFGAALSEPLSCVIAAQERIVHIIKDSPSSPRIAVIGPKKGGVTLIIGAGPMGLMHIEVAMSYRPSKVIVSEILEDRRKNVLVFLEKAKNLGISLILTKPDELSAVINRETNGKGVDDAIVALGIAKVQEESINYLAKGGVAVFFGGTPYKDRMIQLDTHRVHYDGVTTVGSSGSDPSDIARALEMISDGIIDPGNYVVKCGGLDAAVHLLQDVRNQKIDGKGVIYPHTRAPLFDIKAWNLAKERDYMEKHLL